MLAGFAFVSSLINLIYSKQLVLLYKATLKRPPHQGILKRVGNTVPMTSCLTGLESAV